ncbi:MAG TPA: isoprenylcysteine carboxylmethyltransferase family protein [Candidatus Dormibacteraeota bacterium]|nr:isoprenylcysteine carboxylmethyltransferase family protein [Candidatus Dormibacteraeota bacterium]
MPRAIGMLVWTLGAVAMHAVVPFELSRLGDRVARKERTNPVVRGIGLSTVGAGATVMLWALAAHHDAAPRGWLLQSRPTPKQLLRRAPYRMEYLLRTGPYRLSRNPMYVGEAAVWLGWGLFYSCLPVWIGWAIMCAALARVVRWEERRLVKPFGDDYRAYMEAVPRWVGYRRRG